LTRELEAAISAAREAGEMLRKGFGVEHMIRHKGEVDLVTEVDEQAEQMIREELLGTFPTYGMLAEEGGGQTGEEDARWIVDPLDGTTNHAHGPPILSPRRHVEARRRSRACSPGRSVSRCSGPPTKGDRRRTNRVCSRLP
jgi:hypothetical protein